MMMENVGSEILLRLLVWEVLLVCLWDCWVDGSNEVSTEEVKVGHD